MKKRPFNLCMDLGTYLVFVEEYCKYTCNKYKKLKILVLVVVHTLKYQKKVPILLFFLANFAPPIL